ncbi:MAG: hypothetical protein ABJB69_05620 [Spartobacteria bacterium]
MAPLLARAAMTTGRSTTNGADKFSGGLVRLFYFLRCSDSGAQRNRDE